MRIVYLQNEYPVLSQTFVSNEISELRRRGYEVMIVASRRGPSLEEHPEEQPDIVLREAKLGAVLWAHFLLLGESPRAYMRYIAWLLRRGRHFLPWAAHVPFVSQCLPSRSSLHLHTHFATRAAGVAEGLRSTLQTTRTVTVHAADLYRNPLLAVQLENAGVCTVTQHNAAFLHSVGYRRVAVVHCGVDARESARPTITAERSKAVLSVGRLVEKKGHDRLINWIASEDGERYTLRIIGDGPERTKLAALIQARGVEDRVHLLGSQPHGRVLDEIAGADLFALACRIDSSGDADGLPVVLLEAALLGTPIASTNVTGISEFLTDQTGFISQHDDDADLNRSLTEAMTHPQRLERASRARDLVLNDFTVEGQALGLLSAIQEHRSRMKSHVAGSTND